MLPIPIPAERVPVPSLVSSLVEPHVDLYRPSVSIPASEALETTAQALSGYVEKSKSRRFSAALTQLLELHFEPVKTGKTQLSAKAVKSYELTAQRECFSQICEDPGAQKWLEDSIKAGESSYMVVGVMSVLDAEIVQNQLQRRSTGVDLTIPVSTVLSGGTDALGILNPGPGVGWSKEELGGLRYVAPGEMIWAIAYRKIKFDFLKRKSIGSARLDNTIHWKPLAGQRAGDVEDEEEVQVELEDIVASEEEELTNFIHDGGDTTFLLPPMDTDPEEE